MATQKRPLEPSPEPTVTSSPPAAAAAAPRSEQPRELTSPPTTTITHLPFLRMPIFHKSPPTLTQPRVISQSISLVLLPLLIYTQSPLMTTSMHSTMWTTTTIPTWCQTTRIMTRLIMQHLKDAALLIITVLTTQEAPRISLPAHGN